MARIVRDSKYRHVFPEASKLKYEDVRISTKTTEANGIRGNSKFWAVPWQSGGGGTLAVVPSSQFGRLPHDLPLITGHSGAILDFEFNPFDDNMIASCSEDTTVKLWQIPDEGLKGNMKEPLASLDGHGKKVVFSTWNPVAANILASASFDLTCRIWNVGEQAEAFQVELPEQPFSLEWNWGGSLLAATSKDKKMRIIDPRSQAIAFEQKIHEGVKASKLCWVGGPGNPDDCKKIITTGCSQQAERQIGVWDMRKFSSDGNAEPLNMLVLDQGTGALYPHYDEGTKLFFISGKGDGNIRYFEMVDHDPYLHYIDHYSTTTPQKAVTFLPKRCMDVTKHEVARAIKLESTCIVPVSFKVPRKIEAFQSDLFPDCVSGLPTMDADKWIASDAKENVEPLLMSMDPGKGGGSAARATVAGGGAASFVSMKDLKKQLVDAQAKIESLEAENKQLKEELAKTKS